MLEPPLVFLSSSAELRKEPIMNHLYRTVRIRDIHQNRNLDFAGGDHVDVDACVVQHFKHGSRDSRVVDHAGAHHANFCHAVADGHMVKADDFSVFLDDLPRRVQIALGNGKANIFGLISADGL